MVWVCLRVCCSMIVKQFNQHNIWVLLWVQLGFMSRLLIDVCLGHTREQFMFSFKRNFDVLCQSILLFLGVLCKASWISLGACNAVWISFGVFLLTSDLNFLGCHMPGHLNVLVVALLLLWQGIRISLGLLLLCALRHGPLGIGFWAYFRPLGKAFWAASGRMPLGLCFWS